MSALVSVIIPFFNSRKTLLRTVDSVLAQSYQNWELILVDDGSTDDSHSILNDVNDPRIKLIHQRNQGASAARNNGLNHASGEWICFVDSDDSLTPTALEKLLDAASGQADIIAGCYQTSTNEEKECGNLPQSVSFEPSRLAKNTLFWQKYESGIIADLFCGKKASYLLNLGAPWAKLYRREMLEQHSLRFNEQLTLHEDTLFNHLAYSYAREVCLVPTPVYCYLDNPDSLTRSQNARYREHCVAAMKQFHLLHPELPEELLYFSLFRILECWNGIWEATHGKLFQRYRQIKQFRNTSDIQELISNMPLKGNVYINQCDKLELFLLKHKLLAILVFFMPVIRKLRKIKNSGF